MPITICKQTAIIPIEFTGGLFSMFPDTPWISHCVANNPRGELRSVGTVALPQEAFLHGNSYSLHFSADADCTLEIFQLLHDFETSHHTPTWNSISADHKWRVPGAISETDTRLIGTVQIKVGEIGKIAWEKLSASFAGGLNDGKRNCPQHRGLLIRRRDSGMQTVNISGGLKIERNVL